MKIVHISTSTVGGAGLAATRLNNQLVMAGYESSILTTGGFFFRNNQNIFYMRRSFFEMVRSALITKFQKRLSRFVFFSPFSYSIKSVVSHLQKLDPNMTVIHLHNIYNILSMDDLSSLLSKGYRFIFTIHDERFYTGGCHYSFECVYFQTSCRNCPQICWPGKRFIQNSFQTELIFQDSPERIIVVAPSKWIQQRAQSSKKFRNLEIVMIRNVNVVDNEYRKNRVMKVLPIFVGIASMDAYSFIKGGELVLSLQKDLNYGKRFVFLFLSDFKDEAVFWKSINILFVPSIIDNYPNVLVEARSFGIPILASEVGGIPEGLNVEYDSVFDIKTTSNEVLIELFDIVSRKSGNINCAKENSKIAINNAISINEHIELYEKLLKV